MNVTNATAIPTPGTPAYWTPQREAVALVQTWKNTELAPDQELDLLRRIAAHGFASRMMAAHGADVARWVMILETLRELFVDENDENDEEEEGDADLDRPPHGSDFCPRGCQILHGMECGMCGYDGPGVRADAVSAVAEYCCHCRARTHQSTDGICELCGKDAEDTGDTPAAASPASCVHPHRQPQPHTAEVQDTRDGLVPAAPADSTMDGVR